MKARKPEQILEQVKRQIAELTTLKRKLEYGIKLAKSIEQSGVLETFRDRENTVDNNSETLGQKDRKGTDSTASPTNGLESELQTSSKTR